MAYATKSDLLLWIKLEELEIQTGRDDLVVDAALEEAAARLDQVLSQKGTTVPLASPGTYLIHLTCRLSLRAIFGRSTGPEPPKIVQDTWEKAEEELSQILAGTRSVTGEVRGSFEVSSETSRGWRDSSLW